MNMVLSYQYSGSLCPVATLWSCHAVLTPHELKIGYGSTKKTTLCFSTPLLFGRKMPSITGSSSAAASLSTMIEPDDEEDESHPLMMIPADEEDEDGKSLCRFYDYVNKKIVRTNIKTPKEVDDAICVGSSHGWLAYVSRLDCSVFLWNPFTTSPLISLPPIHTLPSLTVIPPEEFDDEDDDDDDDISAYEDDFSFSTSFGFKVECDYPNQTQNYYTRSPKLLSLYIIRKIVLSSTPTSDDCIMVALPRLNVHRGIAFCKPGDKSWTFVESPIKKSYQIEDVIHFKDQFFYTVSDRGRTLYGYDLADISSPKSYLVETCFDFEPLSSLEERIRSWCRARYYLVESLGDLLWVRRLITNSMNGDGKFIFSDDVEFPDQTIKFDVYRLNFSKNTWECIKCIGDQGDQVLFLGTNQSLSLSARDFPSLKANGIYFTDDCTSTHKKYPPYGGQDFGHYELGGSAFGELRFGDGKFLPPPFWVMLHFH